MKIKQLEVGHPVDPPAASASVSAPAPAPASALARSETQGRSSFTAEAHAPAPAPVPYVDSRSLRPVADPAQLDVDAGPALKMIEQIRSETGLSEPLKGKRFAVVLESEFIPTEQKAYAVMIRELGGEVEFSSHLWGQPKLTFFSDVQGDWDKPQVKHHLEVSKDIVKDVLPNLSKYAGVIFSANDTMKRLNYTPEVGSAKSNDELTKAFRERPLGKLVDAVMRAPGLLKAFNCHALWALAHHPEHARGLTMAFNGVMAGEAMLLGVRLAPNPEGQDVHLHTHADGNVLSNAAGVNGGTEALIRRLVQTALKNDAQGAAP
jgi:hypothetical protein